MVTYKVPILIPRVRFPDAVTYGFFFAFAEVAAAPERWRFFLFALATVAGFFLPGLPSFYDPAGFLCRREIFFFLARAALLGTIGASFLTKLPLCTLSTHKQTQPSSTIPRTIGVTDQRTMAAPFEPAKCSHATLAQLGERQTEDL